MKAPMKKIALSAVVLAAASGAQADTVTFTDSFGLVLTNVTHNIGASQFNLGGVLNSVTFVLSGDIVQRMKAENTGASADILVPVAGANYFFRKSTTVLQTTALSGSAGSFSATAFDGVSDFAGTSGFDFGTLTISTSNVFSFSGAALADFIGAGTLGDAGYNIRMVGAGSISSNNGSLDSSVSTQARYNLSVTYDYTAAPVPEPASMAMLLAGLGALGFLMRRRQNR